MRTGQLQGPAVGIPQVKARRFQQAVGFEQANLVFPPSRQDLDQALSQVPGIEDHHAKGHFVPDGRFDQLDRQGNFGPELLVPRPQLRVLEQHRVDLRMQAIPCLPCGGDPQLRKLLGHRRFPLGQFLIAAIEAHAEGKAHRATDIKAGAWVMRQGVGAVAMLVMAVHMV